MHPSPNIFLRETPSFLQTFDLNFCIWMKNTQNMQEYHTAISVFLIEKKMDKTFFPNLIDFHKNSPKLKKELETGTYARQLQETNKWIKFQVEIWNARLLKDLGPKLPQISGQLCAVKKEKNKGNKTAKIVLSLLNHHESMMNSCRQ